jgi:hypothetical protein
MLICFMHFLNKDGISLIELLEFFNSILQTSLKNVALMTARLLKLFVHLHCISCDFADFARHFLNRVYCNTYCSSDAGLLSI